MGIALPKWIVESKNNVWVLGVYGLIFGGALPTLVVSVRLLVLFFLSKTKIIGTLVVRLSTKN